MFNASYSAFLMIEAISFARPTQKSHLFSSHFRELELKNLNLKRQPPETKQTSPKSA